MQEYRTWLEISRSALKSNFANIRNHMQPGELFLAMVKGNAWGCDTLPYAQTLVDAGADWLGVTMLEDGVLLRKAFPNIPILILMEFPYSRIDEALEHQIRMTICTKEMAKAVSDAASKRNTTAIVHIKLNTGLNRIGVSLQDAPDLFAYVASLPNIEIEGACTHFSSADAVDSDVTQKQFKAFNDTIAKIRQNGISLKMLHVANSPATISRPETHLDMVRVGMSLAGLYPSAAFKELICLCFPITWKTRVSYVRHVRKGEGLGYGAHYRCPADTSVATIPVGTADGLSKRFEGCGKVLINDKEYTVSAVSMDQSMVDLCGCNEDVHLGDEVVILGKQRQKYLDPHRTAADIHSDVEEMVCQISYRVPRIYTE